MVDRQDAFERRPSSRRRLPRAGAALEDRCGVAGAERVERGETEMGQGVRRHVPRAAGARVRRKIYARVPIFFLRRHLRAA